jgi:hypothetical protein
MSRIFKRPMFRKGGNVMEGIMTGIQDRKNYAEDGIVTSDDQENEQVFNSSAADNAMLGADYFMNKYGKGGDPLAQALISGGLRAVGGAGAGKGKAAELATAFSPVVDRAFEQMQKQKDSRLGLGVEIFKSMQGKNKELSNIVYGKELGRLREKIASGEKLTSQEQGTFDMLNNLLKDDKFLSTDRPEVQMEKEYQNITKDYQSQNKAGVNMIEMNEKEIARIAKKRLEVRQGVYGDKDSPDFITNVFPIQKEISQTEDPNIFKFNPQKGNENKFISGGRYYIPTLDKFGTYDGNTRQFTIVE